MKPHVLETGKSWFGGTACTFALLFRMNQQACRLLSLEYEIQNGCESLILVLEKAKHTSYSRASTAFMQEGKQLAVSMFLWLL
jgi:hypothetical protein